MQSAQEAYDKALDETKLPLGRSSSFVCPFPNCNALSQHHWGFVGTVHIRVDARGMGSRQLQPPYMVTALCESCNQEVVFLGGKLLWPSASDVPAPAKDMPVALLGDYNEAAAICRLSPRGAAALLRLLIQKLCFELGAPEKEINAAIGGFVASGRITSAIQKALDAVRVIGNEAVHPGTMDLSDDAATVNSLFGLINFIVEKMITEPKEIDAIYSSLPEGKLAGIASRDRSSNN